MPYVPRHPAPGEIERISLEDLERAKVERTPDGKLRQTPPTST